MLEIVNTGVANIRSLQAAFDRLGQPWHLTEDPQEILAAEFLVLPGVGSFAAATEQLDRLGIRQALRDRLQDDRKPSLCICLGMQLLMAGSEEAPGAVGLGVIDRQVLRFPTDVPVPQLGWNRVVPQSNDASEDAPLVEGEAYFANSFRLVDPPEAPWGLATTDYGGQFVSSLWRGRILACQFHPELSGQWGGQLLASWLAGHRQALAKEVPTC